MHRETAEKTGTPRKRTLSRGMSEEESLRYIIKEAEENNKRLSLSDSRFGSMKRGQRGESLCEDDTLTEPPEMRDISSDDAVQELQVEREVLLFQVDCLQDALERTEEMLAEAQREVDGASMELEREREARRKLEDMVRSLKQEVDRLKEESNSIQVVPDETSAPGTAQQDEKTVEDSRELHVKKGNLTNAGHKHDQKQVVKPSQTTTLKLGDVTPAQSPKATDGTEVRTDPPWLHGAPMGTSVDEDHRGPVPEKDTQEGGNKSPQAILTRILKTFGRTPSLEVSEPPQPEGILQSPRAGQGVSKADTSPTRDHQEDNDEISCYEDARSELQEQEAIDSSTPDGPPLEEAGFPEDDKGEEEDEGIPADIDDAGSPKKQDCILS
ncbi:uncharacterized protein LOC114800710 [Denticeps clupeoides]|uniref:uncharacterized protein LOC114800710 n=1 Tax=Denticeps clupeoides TaxID=299321 RepID=UPI0010A3BB54|nr:uncharacterized protein LOC114800710 [Denticeps clupeoides]